jgi:hypothetical protein
MWSLLKASSPELEQGEDNYTLPTSSKVKNESSYPSLACTPLQDSAQLSTGKNLGYNG